MKRISLIRHGQSLGNKKRIIQGTNTDYELTEEGVEYITSLAKENKSQFASRKIIYTSPLKRARQTAEILSKVVGIKNVVESPLLVEFNPGILSEKSHDEAREKYPEAYAVWLERKDLDRIPFAEKGNELQARVLAFLTRYIEQDNYDDIIVSHAGFIRCFINTILSRERTTPIEIHNGVVYELKDPLQNLSIEKKDRAMTSNVYVIETHEGKYVVKQKRRSVNNKDREEKKILSILDTKMHGIPVIYGLFDDGEKSYKVLKHIEGEHIYGSLDREYEIALLREFKVMSKNLAAISSSEFETLDIIDDLKKMAKTCRAYYQKKYVNELCTNYRNIAKLNQSEYVLSHNDLNRDNILFKRAEDGMIHANFIDWEGIDRSPREYQIATFLTSSFLIEGYSVGKVMKLAEAMEPCIDKDFLSYLMQIRVFKGLHFFAEQRNEFTLANQGVSKEILIKYYNASEQIKEYRLHEGFDKKSSVEYFRRLIELRGEENEQTI